VGCNRTIRRRSAAAIAAAIAGLGATAALAGAASSNGVAAKSPSAIVAAARAAIGGVSTVHVYGSGIENGEPISLNLSLVAGRGGRGTVTENGAAFQLVVIGKTLYFEGSAAFWKKAGGGSAATALFAGRWLKAPTTGQFASVVAFTSIKSLFAELLAPKGSLSKGALSTVLGQQVVPVTDHSDGGILYVAASGPPYPVELVGPATKHDVVVIDDIGKPVSLTAPPGAIDISQLTGT
jgi:hypothetical protein